MPELPEVETIVRHLRTARLGGQVIRRARVRWAKTVAPHSPAGFARQIRNSRIETIARRAKYIVMTLADGRSLIIHLRMTGHLDILPPQTPPRRSDRMILELADGRQLHFEDARKFGRVWLTSNSDQILSKLGPEPLTLRVADFRRRLHGRTQQLKPLLLDQHFIAGIGNIYADEALWHAQLHPRRRADTLSPQQVAALYEAIRVVLRRGIRNLGTTLGGGTTHFVLPQGERGRNQEKLNAYGQTGLPCTRCGAKIRRLVVNGRATHICPACQRAPRRDSRRGRIALRVKTG